MAKTRSQTVIKREEEDSKDIQQLLYATSNKAKKPSKITKRKPPKSKTSPAQQVKKEEDESGDKFLLKALPGYTPKVRVTEEQIKQLVDLVDKENMSIKAASKMVNISYGAGLQYYKKYKKNPHGQLIMSKRPPRVYTHDEIKTFIQHIVNDGMSVREAAAKVNMPNGTACCIYKRYQCDPNHNIPLSHTKENRRSIQCSHEQVKELIGYIVHDNLPILVASIKAKISVNAARKYYRQYLIDPNHEIPVPKRTFSKPCTKAMVEQLIHHIVNDKMSVLVAALKLNITESTARRYYRDYLGDPDRKVPVPTQRRRRTVVRHTPNQVKDLIGYIVHDNMSIGDASAKANMTEDSGKRYHQAYLDDPNHTIPMPKQSDGGVIKSCTQEQINELIHCIVDKKMTMWEASFKTKISKSTVIRYYRKYLNDPNHQVPSPEGKKVPFSNVHSQENIEQLISYIVDDNMSIPVASVKANMCESTARKYYRLYENDPQHRIPSRKSTSRLPVFEKRLKMFFGYMMEDRMSVQLASVKAKICETTARKYYKKYLEDPHFKKSILDEKDELVKLISKSS